MKTKKQTIFIAIFISLLISCLKDEKSKNIICEVTNPLEELEWLKAIKERFDSNSSGSQIIYYKYKDEDVFWVDPCINVWMGLILFLIARVN